MKIAEDELLLGRRRTCGSRLSTCPSGLSTCRSRLSTCANWQTNQGEDQDEQHTKHGNNDDASAKGGQAVDPPVSRPELLIASFEVRRADS
jgi:hypothetical protein